MQGRGPVSQREVYTHGGGRRPFFLALAAILANAITPKAQVREGLTREPGVLSVDLDQWKEVRILHGGKVIDLTPETIFRGLEQ